MLELRLIGVHDDGENLVLESADGTRFLLPIDANLRTSITKARRIQPLRGRGTKGSFGPRDIQTRFRQGASVEEIAEESGWEPERVRRYEWPIVAERSHIIRAAQNVKVGRRDSASGIGQIPVTLAARIAEIAHQHGFEDATQDWETRQKENGQWRVEADFALSDEARANLSEKVRFPARWTYNPANQGLYASNEAAYFLMGSPAAVAAAAKKTSLDGEDEEHEEHPEATAPVQQRLVTTHTTPVHVNAPTSSLKGESRDERKLNELLERARSVRPVTPVVEEPEVYEPEPDTPQSVEAVDEHDSDDFAPSTPEHAHHTSEPKGEHHQNNRDGNKTSSSKKQRRSIPAWDDILFGGRK